MRADSFFNDEASPFHSFVTTYPCMHDMCCRRVHDQVVYPVVVPVVWSCQSPIRMPRLRYCSARCMQYECSDGEVESAQVGVRAGQVRDVDYVLTAVQLASILRQEGVDLFKLQKGFADDPLGISGGAGALFGTTGRPSPLPCLMPRRHACGACVSLCVCCARTLLPRHRPLDVGVPTLIRRDPAGRGIRVWPQHRSEESMHMSDPYTVMHVCSRHCGAGVRNFTSTEERLVCLLAFVNSPNCRLHSSVLCLSAFRTAHVLMRVSPRRCWRGPASLALHSPWSAAVRMQHA